MAVLQEQEQKNTWTKWASLIRQSQETLLKEVMSNEVLGNVTALTTAHNVAKKDKKPGALRRKEDGTFQMFRTPYLMHRISGQTLFFRDLFWNNEGNFTSKISMTCT